MTDKFDKFIDRLDGVPNAQLTQDRFMHLECQVAVIQNSIKKIEHDIDILINYLKNDSLRGGFD